jgi:hypothetical protein
MTDCLIVNCELDKNKGPNPKSLKKMEWFKIKFSLHLLEFNKKKLRGFSPPANYTDRATVACRRS